MADVQVRSELSPQAIHWTRKDCEALERAGVLNYRYELVEGVINRMGQNLGHAGMVQRLLAWLFSVFGSEFVLTQMTIDVRPEDNPTSEPEPDVIVLARRDVELLGNPTANDLRLCIEAADTTLSYDLTTKAGLYARAGIPEYWVLSLPERKLYVHRLPLEGVYKDVTACLEGETISPLAAPEAITQVSALLPPLSER
jgi:Uma2 family endonuclease